MWDRKQPALIPVSVQDRLLLNTEWIIINIIMQIRPFYVWAKRVLNNNNNSNRKSLTLLSPVTGKGQGSNKDTEEILTHSFTLLQDSEIHKFLRYKMTIKLEKYSKFRGENEETFLPTLHRTAASNMSAAETGLPEARSSTDI